MNKGKMIPRAFVKYERWTSNERNDACPGTLGPVRKCITGLKRAYNHTL